MPNSIITITAKAKMAKARAGISPVPAITKMAFGTGGATQSGDIITPGIDDIALKHEILRKNVESITKITETSYRYLCTLEIGELPGQKISEIALIDADGDAVTIRAFTPKPKDSDIEMPIEIDDIF
jgi:phage-related tail fiber protein